MKFSRLSYLYFLVLILFNVTIQAQNTAGDGLWAGASKVNITPSLNELPDRYTGIHDSIFSRALVLKNRVNTVAFVTIDIGAIRTEHANSIRSKIESQFGIPKANIMLTATHTHSVPFGMGGEKFEALIVKSVEHALSKLQKAKIGYGEGSSYLNVNRNMIDSNTRLWTEGPNYDGPSDKTVSVVQIQNLKDQPLAILYNYAMHAVISGMFDQVSGDVPGAASRYLENHFNDSVVALWSTGACGDQNPIYYQQTYDLREIRINDYAQKGEDISNKMPPGGEGLDRNNPRVKTLLQEQEQMLLSMGQLLSEEVLHVLRKTNRFSLDPNIYINQKTITCPGRKRIDEGRSGYAGTYEPADPIEIDLGLIVVGDIAFSSVNGEVFNPIFQNLKKKSPYSNTLMLTLTNGYAKSGYIPNDASFGTYTFEVLSSRLQPGCAENSIVDGLLDMMHQSLNERPHNKGH